MTASVNILRGDLHLAVSTALNRGRYVLMTDGAGRPKEITLDLKERDDDLFGSESYPERFDRATRGGHWVSTDDHGPSVPAQGWTGDTGSGWKTPEADPSPVEEYGFAGDDGPTRYEIQIQALARSAGRDGIELTLENVTLDDVLRWGDALRRAERCDYVHVYDRVTRERRTLKRPEPDRILTGLQDVAADLRGKRGRYVGEPITVTDAKGKVGPGTVVSVQENGTFGVRVDFPYFVEAEDEARTESPLSGWTFFSTETQDFGLTLKFEPFTPVRGAPVEPPFGCKPAD